MNKTILFSPVGGTDPISENNLRDGSMLHICRFYKPDKVVLYMSKEILEHHKADNRYLLCLDKLGDLLGFHMDYEIIEKNDLVDVQEYDYFYEDFRKIISEIYESMDNTDTLILNVSSGTPSMKSGLLVLKTLGEFNCKLIQVRTPAKKMNDHTHREKDIITLWELDEDNEADCENRCEEIQCPTLSNIKNEEIVKRLIRIYDYEGALQVAHSMEEEATKNYIKAIEMASRRMLFDFSRVDKLGKECGIDCLAVKDERERKIIEYALNLEIKLKKSEYCDFVRGLSPLLFDLFENAINKSLKIKVSDFWNTTNGVRKWNIKKIKSEEIGKILDDCYNGFEGGFVKTDHLSKLINYHFSEERFGIDTSELRKVEEKMRNLAAHEIVSVTDNSIQNETGLHGCEIMERIKKYFSYTSFDIKEEYWDSYDQMNTSIISLIENKFHADAI